MSKFVSLKSITNKIGSGATPRGGQDVYKDSGISLIRSQNVLDFKFGYDGLAFIDEEQASKLEGVTVQTNDVLLNITGDSIARACIVPDDVLPARVNQHVSIIRCKDRISSKYVLYYLQHLKPYLLRLCRVGGTRNALTKEAIEKLKIRLRDDQFKIAAVLSALDAKIELNNRINTELESLAKTIYDYWFVQFDFPFDFAQGKPSADGKPYKSSGGEMVYVQEGKGERAIPAGWEVKKLREFANTASGGTPLSTKSEYYEKGDIAWINSGEVNNRYITEANNFITHAGLDNSSAKLFEPNTLLVAMYGATAGKVSLLQIHACTNQAICAITPNSIIYNNFLKFALDDLYKHLINLSTGSARDNLSQDIIKNLKFTLPEENLLIRFNKVVNPIISKILVNQRENQQLTQLRDWLLPMLMNGQVSIK